MKCPKAKDVKKPTERMEITIDQEFGKTHPNK